MKLSVIRKDVRVLLLLLMLCVMMLSSFGVGEVYAESVFGGKKDIRAGSEYDGNLNVYGGALNVGDEAQVYGDISIFGGKAEIGEDAVIDGTIRVYGGEIDIYGTVSEDIITLGGETKLRESAVIEGDVKTIGGTIKRESGAEIWGDVSRMDGGKVDIDVKLNPFKDSSPRDVVNNGIKKFFRFFSNIFFAGFLAVIAMIALPTHLSKASTTLRTIPLQSMLVGLAVLLGILVATVILSVTVILIPLALILVLILIALLMYGYVTLGYTLGEELRDRLNMTATPMVATIIGTLTVSLVLSVLRVLPDCVEWIPQFGLAVLGVGAVVTYHYEAYAQTHRGVGETLFENADDYAGCSIPQDGAIAQSGASQPAAEGVTPADTPKPENPTTLGS